MNIGSPRKAAAVTNMLGEGKGDKDARPKGCVNVGHPLTEAEVCAQGHVERIRKGNEMTLEITCRFALFGIKSNESVNIKWIANQCARGVRNESETLIHLAARAYCWLKGGTARKWLGG